MFGKKKKDKQINNTNEQLNASDNTYSDYYESTPNVPNTQNGNMNNNNMNGNVNNNNFTYTPQQPTTQFYTAENSQKNKTKEFKDPNSPNSFRSKFAKLILVLLGILAIVLVFYSFVDSQYGEHEIKLNLTSVGLLKTQGLTTSYQINYLVLPVTGKIPKFKIHDNEIVTLNETTSYITSASLGETTIDVLDVNDNKEVKNSLKVYIVDKRIKIEDFAVGDITLKKGTNDMITITPIPANTTEINFSYKSSDPEIVRVNNNGIIEGVKKGVAQIAILNNKIVKYINVTVV